MRLAASAARFAASVVLLVAAIGCPGSTEPDTTPASVVITPAGAQTIVSGTTRQLTAEVRTKGGKALPGVAVTWSTSAGNIATVSSGLVTGLVAGAATITASVSPTVTSSTSVTVTPGAASRLEIRTQPTATAGSGVTLGTQPVVDVKDAAGNLVASTAAITATVVESGGTLGGTVTVNAVGGSAAFQGLSLSGLAGLYTLRFSSTGLTPATSTTIALTAGAATRLTIRTQPSGAASGAAFTTQPVIEVRDAVGNLVTSATNAVTASIASGGGTLGGTATINAVAGVATFTNLSVTGTAGDRTLQFAATGLTSATSAAFTVTTGGGGSPPLIVATPASLTFTGAAGGNNPPPATTSITNGGSQPLGTLSGGISYPNGNAGWLTGSFSSPNAPATLTMNANTANLAPGTYTANVLVNSVGASNSPLTIPVTLTLTAAYTLTYGTGNRVVVLDANGTTTPAVVVRDPAGAVVPSPQVSFATRGPAVATVSATGTVTAVSTGQTWIVATGNVDGSPRDSVLAVVTRDATGPVLRADVPNVVVSANDVITVPIVLDMRSAGKLSAATVTITWPADFFTGFLTYLSHTLGPSNISPVVSVNASQGIARISVANAAGVDGPVELMRLTFRAINSGRTGLLVLTANEVVTSDLTDVTVKTTAVNYPLRVR